MNHINEDLTLLEDIIKPVFDNMGVNVKNIPVSLTDNCVPYCLNGEKIFVRRVELSKQILDYLHETAHVVCKNDICFNILKNRKKGAIRWLAMLIGEIIADRFERNAFLEYNKVYNLSNKLMTNGKFIDTIHYLAWYISVIPFPIFIKLDYKLI